MIPDGVFPTIALSGGLGTLAVRQGDPRVPGWLVVYRFPVTDPTATTELTRIGLPAGSPCFPNLYVLDGLLWLAFNDGVQQRLLNMTSGTEERFTALSNPSAFGAGYFAYTEPVQPYRVHRINLRSGEVDQPRIGAPTGLSRILDSGYVVTIDEDRFALPGATIPSFAGPLAVGEGREGGALWTHTSGATGTLYRSLESFTPKCAADGETLAITTAGSGSVRLFCGSLAQLIAASDAPVAPPPPPPPPPDDKKEEPPMSVPNYEQRVREFLGQRLRHFPGDLDRTRAHTFEQVNLLALELRKSDPNVGLLEKLGGDRVRDRAADILLYRLNDAEAQVLDVVGDAEGADGPPRPGWSVKDIRSISQWKLPYSAGGSEPPTNDPPVVNPPVVNPPPAVDLSPLMARIKELRDDLSAFNTVIGELAKDVEALRARPAVDPAAIEAVLVGYEVNGKTERDRLGLQHVVKLGITKRKP